MRSGKRVSRKLTQRARIDGFGDALGNFAYGFRCKGGANLPNVEAGADLGPCWVTLRVPTTAGLVDIVIVRVIGSPK